MLIFQPFPFIHLKCRRNPNTLNRYDAALDKKCEKNMRINFVLPMISAMVLLNTAFLWASEDKLKDSIEIVSEYTYQLSTGESENLYESLCLFGAKYKAVFLSAKYLAHKGLLRDYGNKEKEIFCLAADGIRVSVIDKKIDDTGRKCSMKIKSRIRVTDFMKAEIKNGEFEDMEKKFSWKEEMEQHVFNSIEPGKELSRAYRYLRQRHWRIAIIYLNHLEKKYPNWDEIYFAKAIGFYATNNQTAMIEALNTSCKLGNREACEDAKSFLH